MVNIIGYPEIDTLHKIQNFAPNVLVQFAWKFAEAFRLWKMFNLKIRWKSLYSTWWQISIQSNLYNMITLGTTQKWLPWKGVRLIKNLYQATTKFGCSCQVLVFFNNECFIRNKAFGVLVPFVKIKNVFSYFWFWMYIY